MLKWCEPIIGQGTVVTVGMDKRSSSTKGKLSARTTLNDRPSSDLS